MVVACLALFVAGTGTGAAVVNALPKNSVGTAQLKANAVVSSKVKNRSLKAVDFATGELPKGAKGDKGDKGDAGAKGDTGAPGLSEVERVDATIAASSADKVSTPTCPTGKRVIGGGYKIEAPGGLPVTRRITVTQAFPDSDGTKFNVMAVENDATVSSWSLTTYALCAKVS